ncbi:MAG: CapA family protein [Myxococcaceae bacterium]
MSPALILLVLAQSPDAGVAQRMTLVFGGDIIPHDPIKYVAKLRERTGEDGNNFGWDHVLGPLSPVLQRSDFAIVNLETPIVTIRQPETGVMTFNAQPPLLLALKRAGVDVATFANNHCLDQHREGIVATREYLRATGLMTAGADLNEESAWTPLVLEKNGLRVGVLAVSRWLNGYNNKPWPDRAHVPTVPYKKEPIVGGHTVDDFLATIRARAAEVDALIVFIHWGEEYHHQPQPEDRVLARQMLDAGAFAVVGHHPHVLQPVEFIEPSQGGKRLVAFSLGNLVSNQDFDRIDGDKKDGLLLELEVVRDADGVVRLQSAHGVPVVTENTLGGGKKRNIQARLLDDELSAMEERLVELSSRTDKDATAERKELLARRKLALDRRARITGFLPESLMLEASSKDGSAPSAPGAP